MYSELQAAVDSTREFLSPEQLTQLLKVCGVIALAMAFTLKQRLWIKRRDGNRCQLPGFLGIQCDPKLEVDHIIPQRYAESVLGMPDEEVNSAMNGITLCRNHHRGHPESKHPDAHQALWEYQTNKRSFFDLFGKRNKQCETGEEYWNGKYDAPESAIVLRNTVVYERKHPEDPFPEHRKKK